VCSVTASIGQWLNESRLPEKHKTFIPFTPSTVSAPLDTVHNPVYIASIFPQNPFLFSTINSWKYQWILAFEFEVFH